MAVILILKKVRQPLVSGHLGLSIQPLLHKRKDMDINKINFVEKNKCIGEGEVGKREMVRWKSEKWKRLVNGKTFNPVLNYQYLNMCSLLKQKHSGSHETKNTSLSSHCSSLPDVVSSRIFLYVFGNSLWIWKMTESREVNFFFLWLLLTVL